MTQRQFATTDRRRPGKGKSFGILYIEHANTLFVSEEGNDRAAQCH